MQVEVFKNHILPQAEQFWSHETSLEHRILLGSRVIVGHRDLYGVGDEHKMVGCMPSAMRQPRHSGSVSSIAMSMQNELL